VREGARRLESLHRELGAPEKARRMPKTIPRLLQDQDKKKTNSPHMLSMHAVCCFPKGPKVSKGPESKSGRRIAFAARLPSKAWLVLSSSSSSSRGSRGRAGCLRSIQLPSASRLLLLRCRRVRMLMIAVRRRRLDLHFGWKTKRLEGVPSGNAVGIDFECR
jgi:hypothetical protein